MRRKTASRREILQLSGAALVLGYGARQDVVLARTTAERTGVSLNAFVTIDSAGRVTLVAHRAEMGQGIHQSIPQILAEELEVEMADVVVVCAPADEKRYGDQLTGGSSTVRIGYQMLGRMGASAREMLIEAARRRWKARRADCVASQGAVIHRRSGRRLAYGALVAEAARLGPPPAVELKKRSQYRLIGKPLLRLDSVPKTNGEAVFGMDHRLPGLLHAVVERSPRFLGKVKSFDAAKALAIPGVKKVFKVQMEVFSHLREGVAVVADSFWAAQQGRQALKVDWDDSGFPHYDSERLAGELRAGLQKPPITFRTVGSVDAALAKAARKLQAVYETPYQAHACMEPVNCTAHVRPGKCEIWGPIQTPALVQANLAKHLGLAPADVEVKMTFLGGGFGRKAFTDFPHEAAMISREMNAPVQVAWTREDDMTQGPFRPGAAYACRGGVDGAGKMVALAMTMSTQSLRHQNPGADRSAYNPGTLYGFVEGYFQSVPHLAFGDVPLSTPIPVMWWRSVYASTSVFAAECFIDELAAAAGKDPLAFRKSHLATPRYTELLDRLAAETGWRSRQPGSGWGMAMTDACSSLVAQAVKVSKAADGGVKVDRVVSVVDCGWYVNPNIIRAQIEGSVVMGLGAATRHAIHFAGGRAVERNFDAYDMPRIQDTPAIEVHIMENDERPGGIGEPGLPAVAPALCNAIFDLTGKRIRALPVSLGDL